MSKVLAENLDKLSVSFLNQQGSFRYWASGTITWSEKYSKTQRQVHYQVSLHDIPHLRVSYSYEDPNTREEVKMDYQIGLTTTHCRYSGSRFWFLCPVAKNYVPCGKRVGVLYLYGQYFMCRHCCEITYASRNLSGRHKGRSRIISFSELDTLRSKVKRTHYQGKPTKKYIRYLEMDRRGYASFAAGAQWILTRKNR